MTQGLQGSVMRLRRDKESLEKQPNGGVCTAATATNQLLPFLDFGVS